MLGQKDRVSAHGRLFAVTLREGRRQTFLHKGLRMAPDDGKALFLHISQLFRPEGKAAAEIGVGKPVKQRGKTFRFHPIAA